MGRNPKRGAHPLFGAQSLIVGESSTCLCVFPEVFAGAPGEGGGIMQPTKTMACNRLASHFIFLYFANVPLFCLTCSYPQLVPCRHKVVSVRESPHFLIYPPWLLSMLKYYTWWHHKRVWRDLTQECDGSYGRKEVKKRLSGPTSWLGCKLAEEVWKENILTLLWQ